MHETKLPAPVGLQRYHLQTNRTASHLCMLRVERLYVSSACMRCSSLPAKIRAFKQGLGSKLCLAFTMAKLIRLQLSVF
jgi:hypothetical protein